MQTWPDESLQLSTSTLAGTGGEDSPFSLDTTVISCSDEFSLGEFGAMPFCDSFCVFAVTVKIRLGVVSSTSLRIREVWIDGDVLRPCQWSMAAERSGNVVWDDGSQYMDLIGLFRYT